MEDTLIKPIETEAKRDEKGLFLEGTAPGPGRPAETPEDKIVKKATKQLIQEYKEALAEALPLIRPALIKKAVEGDVQAMKELHDRAMGKAPQTLLGDKENPLRIITVDKDLAKIYDITQQSEPNS